MNRKTELDMEVPLGCKWNPSSWRSRPICQSPSYPDALTLKQAERAISSFPPLVYEGEILRLKEQLALVERGEAFLLQGGSCAESFSDFKFETIRDSFQVLLQMAIVLTFGTKKPVIKVGRMAGQFAKPRSSDYEVRGELSLPAFRGDIINGFEFTLEQRTPDPKRMEKAYFQSAAMLNVLRALSKGGFSDLQRIHSWNLEFIKSSKFGAQYEEVSNRIDESMAFLRAAGIKPESALDVSSVEFFTSHESLLLPYEEALTRNRSLGDGFYAGSAHMLWIGDRTRQLDGAHVEYARGISNPIGLKCGPSMTVDELLRLSDRLNPTNEAGRLVVITRFGSKNIANLLPQFLRRLKSEGRRVLWCCDPMHGNNYSTQAGVKTRSFEDILQEARKFFEIHKAEGTIAGGVHFELTGKDVTECIGGAQGINESQIDSSGYESLCDPRLNASQSLELAFQLVR
jgi:3-deoxy-7-phosphoheptulonate synthase